MAGLGGGFLSCMLCNGGVAVHYYYIPSLRLGVVYQHGLCSRSMAVVKYVIGCGDLSWDDCGLPRGGKNVGVIVVFEVPGQQV